MELTVHLESPEDLDPLAHLDSPEHLEHLDPKENPPSESLELRERRVPQDSMVSLDFLEPTVCLDSLEKKENLENMAAPDLEDHLETQDSLETLGSAQSDQRESRATPVFLGPQGHPADPRPNKQALRPKLAPKAQKGGKERRENQDK
jgi:hypothetical protein